MLSRYMLTNTLHIACVVNICFLCFALSSKFYTHKSQMHIYEATIWERVPMDYGEAAQRLQSVVEDLPYLSRYAYLLRMEVIVGFDLDRNEAMHASVNFVRTSNLQQAEKRKLAFTTSIVTYPLTIDLYGNKWGFIRLVLEVAFVLGVLLYIWEEWDQVSRVRLQNNLPNQWVAMQVSTS